MPRASRKGIGSNGSGVAHKAQCSRDAVVDPAVADDLPSAVPVATAELETIETYLGKLIDQLLADADAPSRAQSASMSKSVRAAKAAGLERD